MYTQKGQQDINKQHRHKAGNKPAIMTAGVGKQCKKGERGESK